MNSKQHAEGDGRTEAAHDARVTPDRRRDEVRRRRWQPASNGAPERRPFIQLNAIPRRRTQCASACPHSSRVL